MMIVFILVYLEPLLWCLTRSIGAGIVKYTEKMLRYIKNIFFVVKHLIEITKCCLNWIFFMTPFIVALGTQI